MISTVERTLEVNDGVLSTPWKELPNWYGIENIGFIWRGAWSDPEIEYKGRRLNATIVEDTMWERYKEYCDENNWKTDERLSEFIGFMKDNSEDVYELIELALGGC